MHRQPPPRSQGGAECQPATSCYTPWITQALSSTRRHGSKAPTGRQPISDCSPRLPAHTRLARGEERADLGYEPPVLGQQRRQVLVAMSTSRSTRSGQSSAKAMAMRPPSEIPARCARDRCRSPGTSLPADRSACPSPTHPGRGRPAPPAGHPNRATRNTTGRHSRRSGAPRHPAPTQAAQQARERAVPRCGTLPGTRRTAHSGRPLSAGWLALRY
jgi:hypothetical protein